MPLFRPVGDDWPPQCHVIKQISLRCAPTTSKGLFGLKEGYCCLHYFQSSSNVTYKADSGALPHLAVCASAKEPSASEGKALQWKEFAIAVRLGGDCFTFCPPWWLKSHQPGP